MRHGQTPATQPWPNAGTSGRPDKIRYYQYRHDRARRTLRGTDEQMTKAEENAAGMARLGESSREVFGAATGAHWCGRSASEPGAIAGTSQESRAMVTNKKCETG